MAADRADVSPHSWLSDLKQSELVGIVSSAVPGEDVRSVDAITLSPAPAGTGSSTLACTFLGLAYTTRSGQSRRLEVFAKCARADHVEAQHHMFLSRQQAPVPRLYGSLNLSDGRQVLFVEKLLPFDRDEAGLTSDAKCLRQFLSVTAHFNAIRPCDEHVERLRRQDWGMNLKTAAVLLKRALALADEGELGDLCGVLCRQHRSRVIELANLAASLADPVGAMQVDLCHCDHHHRNVGFRPSTGEMLLIDLELVQLMPRFWDVAQWIGPPQEIRPLCRTRRELARWYLEAYSRHGGAAVEVDELLSTGRTLWITREVCDIWWRLDHALGRTVGDPDNSGHLRKKDPAGLLQLLELLVNHAQLM
jgi:hypothetical protein